MSRIITTGKRYLKDDDWHDDNGPIGGNPSDWDPPMSDEEVELAALADPDCPPSTPIELARMRRVSPARFIRQKLGMSLEGFSAAYAIPVATLRDWECHAAEPSPTERAYLQAIQNAPDAVRKALTSTAA